MTPVHGKDGLWTLKNLEEAKKTVVEPTPPTPEGIKKEEERVRKRKESIELHQYMTCPICYDAFVFADNREKKMPWVLSCGHVVCARCLNSLQQCPYR